MSMPEMVRPVRPDLLHRLLDLLEANGIGYCHWKSNYCLMDSLSRGGDLDLLVDREDMGRFEAVLGSLGIVRAVDTVQGAIPSVSHYYGWDEVSGSWLHLHVYDRIVTGGSHTKG